MQPTHSVHYSAEVIVLEEQEQDDSQSQPQSPRRLALSPALARQLPEHSLDELQSESASSSHSAESASSDALLRSVTVRSVLARALDYESSPVAARGNLQPSDSSIEVNIAPPPSREKQLSSAPDDEARHPTWTPAVIKMTL
jgi:hypothetical protein